MRRTTTLTALLLGATLLVPTGAATAVGETCHGEAATIVGSGPAIQGTDARDVIVTGSSVKVFAGSGDDLICVTGADNFNVLDVDAGPGNDLVDSSALPLNYYLVASLGDGADTFIGGVADERVAAGAAGFIWVDVPSESERDVIDTGDGSDSVVSGGPGVANDDSVRTGSGEDVVHWSGVMGAQGVLDAGADSDLLIARASGQTFGIDLTAQKLSRNGAVEGSFASIERLRVDPEPDLGAVDIVGTANADQVEIYEPAAVRVRLGDGDDALRVAATKGDSRIDLGSGDDQISVRSMTSSVDLNLAHRTLVVDDSPAASLDGVENAFVSAEQATVIGDDRANYLSVIGCFATVEGGKGKDSLAHGHYDGDQDMGYHCTAGKATLRGGTGNDKLHGGMQGDRIYGDGGNDTIYTGPGRSGKNKAWGGAGNDKLMGGSATDVLDGGAGRDRIIGGKGRDVAIGGPDRDRCIAEVKKSCER